MISLSKEQIKRLHENMVIATGGSNGLRDESLLDSALSAPYQTFEGMAHQPRQR